jgi:hypothetical protein
LQKEDAVFRARAKKGGAGDKGNHLKRVSYQLSTAAVLPVSSSEEVFMK